MEMDLRNSIALAALILSLAALLVTYLSGQRRDVTAIRPVLVFEYKPDGWRIHNIGSGPAMDVIFTRLAGVDPYEHVRLPALAKDGALLLHFAKRDNVHRFAATYRDIDGRPYTSQSQDDVSVATSGFIITRPLRDQVKQWWKLAEADA